jgi:DNA-binding GntR family transcriptional regulator
MNRLTLQDVKDAYDIVGALEAAVIGEVGDRLDDEHLDAMSGLNADMQALIEKSDFDAHYAAFFNLNLQFHDHFLDRSTNRQIKKIVMPFKQRLYDFPRRRYIREWERSNCREHDQLIHLLRTGDATAAADLLRSRHWSFSYYEDFIRQFYGA